MLNFLNRPTPSAPAATTPRLVAPPASSSPVVLDIWADLGCPWCYIGSRRLALALAHEPHGSVVTRWRSFQLDPGLPETGVPAAAYFRGIFGSDDLTAAAHDQVRQIGREVGISFDFRRQTIVANTALAQRAVLLYDGEVRQRAVAASLYGAYFERGLNLTDLDVVAREAAQAADDDADRVRARLLAGACADRLEADAIEAKLLRITAIPTYVARGHGIEGAQDVSVLTDFLAQARGLTAER